MIILSTIILGSINSQVKFKSVLWIIYNLLVIIKIYNIYLCFYFGFDVKLREVGFIEKAKWFLSSEYGIEIN